MTSLFRTFWQAPRAVLETPLAKRARQLLRGPAAAREHRLNFVVGEHAQHERRDAVVVLPTGYGKSLV